MLKKMLAIATLTAALTTAAGVGQLRAQESTPAKPAPEATEPGHAYKLDFSVIEIDDGKKVNSRQYSMNLSTGDANEVKIGTRVPVEAKQGEFQYIDVGTSIWCRLRDRKDVAWLGNDVLLNLRAEISNFALPEQSRRLSGLIGEHELTSKTYFKGYIQSSSVRANLSMAF